MVLLNQSLKLRGYKCTSKRQLLCFCDLWEINFSSGGVGLSISSCALSRRKPIILPGCCYLYLFFSVFFFSLISGFDFSLVEQKPLAQCLKAPHWRSLDAQEFPGLSLLPLGLISPQPIQQYFKFCEQTKVHGSRKNEKRCLWSALGEISCCIEFCLISSLVYGLLCSLKNHRKC